MDKIKNIIFMILGAAITFLLLWFFFTIALPILLVLGLIAFVYFLIKESSLFKNTKKQFKKWKKKAKKKKDNIQEAVIIKKK